MEVFVRGGSTVYTSKYLHTSLVPMGEVTLIAILYKQRLVSNTILKPFLEKRSQVVLSKFNFVPFTFVL